MSDREKDGRQGRDDVIPEPDAPPSPAEEARAESFSRLVGDLLSGEPLPPAMDSEDRTLLEAATVVVASTRELELDADRERALIDEALEHAVLGGRRRPQPVPAGADGQKPLAPRPRRDSRADVVSLGSRRADRVLRVLPWAVASVAAAAAIFLYVTRGPESHPGQAARPAPRLTDVHRSRPSDALVGMIQEQDTAHASERLDTIYADRMAGYRDLYFRRKLGGSR